MVKLKTMPWDDLIREFYTPSDPLRRVQITDALREEIRRRVDAFKKPRGG